MAEKDFPSIGIKKKDLSKPVYNTLVEIAMKVSEKRFAASKDDIRTIKSARAEAIKTVTSQFDSMVSTAEQRRENLLKYKGIRFISLGNNGFVNTLLTRWGLKPHSDAIEDEGPFDKGNYSARFVATEIAYDFRDYITASSGQHKETRGSNGRLTVLQPGITSSGLPVSQETIGYYQQIIDNFRRWIGSNESQVIIYHSGDAEPETQRAVQFMFDKLLRDREGRKTLCLWLYTPDPSSPSADWAVDISHLILQAPYPIDDYTWNLPVHVFSGRGQTFEKDLVTGLKVLLERAGLPSDDTTQST